MVVAADVIATTARTDTTAEAVVGAVAVVADVAAAEAVGVVAADGDAVTARNTTATIAKNSKAMTMVRLCRSSLVLVCWKCTRTAMAFCVIRALILRASAPIRSCPAR